MSQYLIKVCCDIIYHDIDIVSLYCPVLLATDRLHSLTATECLYDPDDFSCLCRKPLTFQDLGAHLEKLLSEDGPAEDSTGQIESLLVYYTTAVHHYLCPVCLDADLFHMSIHLLLNH